jgi:hypothetical protein
VISSQEGVVSGRREVFLCYPSLLPFLTLSAVSVLTRNPQKKHALQRTHRGANRMHIGKARFNLII